MTASRSVPARIASSALGFSVVAQVVGMGVLALAWAAAARAQAQAPASPTEVHEKPTLWLEAEACPSVELVAAMLEPLVGHQHALRLGPGSVEARGQAERSAHAAVHDLGDQYLIEVAGVERSQADAARDCKERARVAAVFIALNLRAPAPPPAPAPAPTPAPAPVAEPAPAAPKPADSGPSIQVGLGAFASVAYAPSDQLAPGGGLELWMRRDILQLGLRTAVMGQTKLEIKPSEGGGHAELMRLPSTLFVGAMWRVSRFELGPALGLAVDVLRAQGSALSRTETVWRANLGGYLALQSQLSLSEKWSLSALLSGSFYPRSYALRVEPDDRNAQTPQIWLAAQLGVLCRLR